MRGRLTYCCLLVALLFAATLDASAQRYPERRATRQGTRLYERGDYAGAEQAYRRALELNPELREAAFNLGGAMFRQENGSGAAGVWAPLVADSIAGTETMAAASYNIGNTSLAGQQIDAAIEAYKQSLRLNPDDVEAKFNLAYAQKL
jgi:tetratricopeptide (TPR) repeat protein